MLNVGLFVLGILLQRKRCLAAFCVTVATCCLRKHALFPIGGLQKYKTGILKDVSMAEAGKFASLKEYAFFDQVNAPLPPSPPPQPLCNPPPPPSPCATSPPPPPLMLSEFEGQSSITVLPPPHPTPTHTWSPDSEMKRDIMIMYSFMCYFSILEHKAHYKAKNRTQLNYRKRVHTHAYTHAHTHTHTHTHTLMHAHTHSHTHTL